MTQPIHAEKKMAKAIMAAIGSAITHHVHADCPYEEAKALTQAIKENA
jgi:hypothetical protein